MGFIDLGKTKITSVNEMNIPVCCFLYAPDENNPRWRWTASNYIPRKDCVFESAFIIEADTKEEILEKIHQYIVPLYEIALEKIKTGSLYYWE